MVKNAKSTLSWSFCKSFVTFIQNKKVMYLVAKKLGHVNTTSLFKNDNNDAIDNNDAVGGNDYCQ